MFTNNPFTALTDVLPANAMQIYVILMVLAVFAGTLFDIIHKGSAKYFFENWRRSKNKGPQEVGGGDLVSLAIKTGLVDVLASAEFCSVRRRVARHVSRGRGGPEARPPPEAVGTSGSGGARPHHPCGTQAHEGNHPAPIRT